MYTKAKINFSSQKKIACFDMGSRYIGVALSDSSKRMAFPHEVWEWKQDWDVLMKNFTILEEQGIAKVVIGDPLPLSGDEDDRLHTHVHTLVTQFAEKVRNKGYMVHFMDERVSSIDAENRLHEEGATPYDGGRVDHVAAQIILERYLETKKL